MAVKLEPQWRVQLYPLSAIAYRKYDAFVVADLMADLISGAPSSWGGVLVRGQFAGEFSEWGQLGNDLQLHNVGFARFKSSGEVTFNPEPGGDGAAGFFVRAHTSPMQPTGEDLGVLASMGVSPGTDTIKWNPVNGTWRVTNSLNDMGAPGLQNTNMPAGGAIITTDQAWAAGQGIIIDLYCTTSGQTSLSELPEFVLYVSQFVRITGRQGYAWMLERAVSKNGRVGWEIWGTQEKVTFNPTGETHYKIGLYLLGGRLVWEVNDHTRWYIPVKGDATTPRGNGKTNSDGTPEGADAAVLLGGEKLKIEVKRLRVRCELSSRIQPTSGPLAEGTVSRRVYRTANTTMQNGMLNPVGIGHLPVDGCIDTSLSSTNAYVDYTATLKPTVDGKYTPFLSQILLVKEAQWAAGSGSPVDVSAAVTKCDLNLALPPRQAGAEGSLELDVHLLNQIAGHANVTKDYCPCSIDTRWKFDDGSVSEWQGIFDGHLFGTQGNQPGYNSATVSFTLRDPICRLRAPAAVVKGGAYPLDWAFERKIAEADMASQRDAETGFVKNRDESGRVIRARPLTRSEKSFYSWEAVKEILKMFRGPAEADRLAVFFSPDEPPLFTQDDFAGSWFGVSELMGQTLSSGSLEMQSGFRCPPPFGEDALDWINKFCEDVFAWFMYGYTDRNDTGYPRPIFGTPEEILKNTALVFPVSGIDAQQLLLCAAQFETRPESDVNCVEIWSNPWDKESEYPLAPAFVVGAARFPPSHPRSQENSWERTKILHTKLIRSIQTAKIAAGLALLDLDGATFTFPKYHFELGEARLWPGDVLEAQDSGILGFDGTQYRAYGVHHSYTSDGNGTRTWTTDVDLATMSGREIRALP